MSSKYKRIRLDLECGLCSWKMISRSMVRRYLDEEFLIESPWEAKYGIALYSCFDSVNIEY